MVGWICTTLNFMTGNEIITITIDDGEKRLSTSYSILNADNFNGTKGAYHLMVLDNLVERFENDNSKTN